MHDTLVLVKSTEFEVGHVRGKVGDRVKSKIQNVLGPNDGYTTLCKVSDILSGNGDALEEHEPTLNGSDLTLFKNALVTSCDVKVTTGYNFYFTTLKCTL
jgi:hypothetical protein